MNIESVMITGATAGIGKEVARQLASKPAVKVIYLACRNASKAEVVKRQLEQSTGRSIFELVTMDVADLDSVRSAVASLRDPVDALVLNAGGSGGRTPLARTKAGVTDLFAQNVLGHVVLLETMLESGLLRKTALFVGSEGARGVPKMGIKRPALATSSVDEFAAIITGDAYAGRKFDMFSAYGAAKFVGTLWMSALARRYPKVRLLTVSPGGTKGTDAPNALPALMRLFYKYVFTTILGPLLGLVHSLQVGSRRIVEGLTDESLRSGRFYGSRANVLIGPLVDQADIFPSLADELVQDHAVEAIHRFTAAA